MRYETEMPLQLVDAGNADPAHAARRTAAQAILRGGGTVASVEVDVRGGVAVAVAVAAPPSPHAADEAEGSRFF